MGDAQHSPSRKAPQTELNEQIAESADILIGIFGTRIGTPTERHVSGTVEEIKNHVATGKTAKIYFSDAPISPSKIDPEQYKALQAFKAECEHDGLYATYADTESFRRDFKQHLDIELNAPRYRWLRSPITQQPSTQVSEDSMSLLTAAADETAAHGKGLIFVQSGADGDRIIAGGKQFTDGTARSLARWREAVTQLEQFGYTEQPTPGIGRYEVTNLGYQAADAAPLATPIQISAKVVGEPGEQRLEIAASKPITLRQIDYLHSTETCIASQAWEQTGKHLSVPFNYSKILELSESGRPDKSGYDHSGPVKLRIIFEAKDKRQQMLLPAHLQPEYLNKARWITLIGSAETEVR